MVRTLQNGNVVVDLGAVPLRDALGNPDDVAHLREEGNHCIVHCF